MQYGVVLVTASSKAEAETIAQAVIAAKLAACVNLFPVHSISTWQGKLEEGEEWQLLIKTDLEKFSALAAKIQEVHSYEVPEIIALPISLGSQPFLSWISEQTGG